MKLAPMLAAALLAAPLAAFAQVEHSQATIIGPAYAPVYPSPYASDCAARQDDLARRKAVLDDERVTDDHERDQLDSEAATLNAELRSLDSGNAAAGDCEAHAITSNVFSMEWPPKSGLMRVYPEVDRAAWYSMPEARRKILPAQQPLLDELESVLSKL